VRRRMGKHQADSTLVVSPSLVGDIVQLAGVEDFRRRHQVRALDDAGEIATTIHVQPVGRLLGGDVDAGKSPFSFMAMNTSTIAFAGRRRRFRAGRAWANLPRSVRGDVNREET